MRHTTFLFLFTQIKELKSFYETTYKTTYYTSCLISRLKITCHAWDYLLDDTNVLALKGSFLAVSSSALMPIVVNPLRFGRLRSLTVQMNTERTTGKLCKIVQWTLAVFSLYIAWIYKDNRLDYMHGVPQSRMRHFTSMHHSAHIHSLSHEPEHMRWATNKRAQPEETRLAYSTPN